MAPDLNSLPPSSLSSSPVAVSLAAMASVPASGDSAARGESPSPSPSRSASISLQAAATMNAGLQHEPSRRPSNSSLSRQRQSPQAGRRRSTVLMNLQLNDPSLPAPGEMITEGSNPHRILTPQSMSGSPILGEPRRDRAPSLGELHQELEAEQEAQVNRLLQMIRSQQVQLQQLQAAQGQSQSSVAAEDPPSTSDRSTSMSNPAGAAHTVPTPLSSTPRSPSMSHPRSSFDIARDALHRRSRTPSRGANSPRIRSTSFGQEAGEPHLSGVRDETSYYQAETQNLVRENQMLRHRIRELERQLSEANANAAVTREPPHPSHLTHSTSVSEGDTQTTDSPLATTSETKEE
ncbi:hypothetical protein GGR57DRAFT_194403 [Xylariaceae sp. FL1272]|nr:hypothetical protein GGR57DRAFT_194403 [Xylariaceae sp. FL1272]